MSKAMSSTLSTTAPTTTTYDLQNTCEARVPSTNLLIHMLLCCSTTAVILKATIYLKQAYPFKRATNVQH